MLIESEIIKNHIRELMNKNNKKMEKAKYGQRLYNMQGENSAYFELIKYIENMEKQN